MFHICLEDYKGYKGYLAFPLETVSRPAKPIDNLGGLDINQCFTKKPPPLHEGAIC